MTRLRAPVSNFSNCLKIKEAAEFLGVSTATLRNWDRSGKLKPRRHPHNGYRIYLHEDLQAVLQTAELSAARDAHADSSLDWSTIGQSEHIVQFYEDDDFLLTSVSAYLQSAVEDGGCGIVVATVEHRHEIERRLIDAGVDVVQSKVEGRYLSFDAVELLSTLIVNGALDRARFHEMTVKLFSQIRPDCKPIRAFGEMVALLWKQGNRDSAIALEQLWNELGSQRRFAIMCGYPIPVFDHDEIESIDRVCSCHTRVIPAESFAKTATDVQCMRSVAQLQKQARSLVAEIEHRKAVETELAARKSEFLSAEQSRKEANRDKDKLLAKSAREMREALAPLRNAVDLLDSASSDADSRSKATGLIRRNIAEITRLLDDLSVDADSAVLVKENDAPRRPSVARSASRNAKNHSVGKPSSMRSRRILVVDDNRDSGDTLALLLRLKGYDVSIAHDGLEAIDETARTHPEIILMDLSMPRLDGYDATRRIRQMPGGDTIFIVAVTGWGQVSAIARSKQAGCSAHLVKPVDFLALDQLLTNATT